MEVVDTVGVASAGGAVAIGEVAGSVVGVALGAAVVKLAPDSDGALGADGDAVVKLAPEFDVVGDAVVKLEPGSGGGGGGGGV